MGAEGPDSPLGYLTPLNSLEDSEDGCVRVAVRVRPLITREVVNGSKVCVSVSEAEHSLTLGRGRRFTFDHTFAAGATQVGQIIAVICEASHHFVVPLQGQVYDECVSVLVDSALEGYNASVLAYGQTGSGKTFTLGTDTGMLDDSDRCGIAPRVIR
jgi:citrate lyase alpha subunit